MPRIDGLSGLSTVWLSLVMPKLFITAFAFWNNQSYFGNTEF
jgi:hypothetical protein